MRYQPQSICLILLLLAGFAVSPAVLAQDLCASYDPNATGPCQGFKKHQLICILGGPNAFSKPVASRAELLDQLEKHKDDVHKLLEQKGLGHLTDKLIDAVRDNHGVSEAPMSFGEEFDWMFWRKNGVPKVSGPFCFATKRPYDAYTVKVGEGVGKLEGSGTVVGEPISIDATGSSAGVGVEMIRPDGTRKALDLTSYKWSGTAEHAGTYRFVTQHDAHSFVVPKACVNIAYLPSTGEKVGGASLELEIGEKPVVAPPVTPPPPPPTTCSLQAPAEVNPREEFTVDASGNFDELKIEIVDAEGRAVRTLSPGEPVSLGKPGAYTLRGKATGKSGDASCSSSISVVKPPGGDWTFRVFALGFNPDGDGDLRSVVRPDGVNERSKLSLDGGEGLGISLERHFTDVIGLEGSLLWADAEASLIFDLDNDWEEGEDGTSFLALAIGPNFHLTPNSKVDFYIGPFVGWAELDDVSFRVLGEEVERGLDSDVFLGAQLGLDVPFGERDWGLHLGGRYLDLTVDQDDLEIDVDPLLFELGLFFRF